MHRIAHLVLLPLALLLIVSTAYAQTQTSPTVDALATAIAAKQWTIVFGVGVYFVTAVAKQGWLGAFVAKIPAGLQPLVALVLAQLSLAGLGIFHGAPVATAMLQALEATAYAVLTHQVVIEGLRRGKEIVPVTRAVASYRASIAHPTPKVPSAVASTMLSAFALSILLPGCSPSVWQQIENTVETDLDNGVILSSIEAAVATLDPSLASIAGAVDTVIQAIIDDLEANGKLTPTQMANAENVKTQIKAKLTTLSDADHALLRERDALIASPALVRVVLGQLAR